MDKGPFRLILASRSPRRRELLAEAGYRFEVIPPSDEAEADEGGGDDPAEVVARLAQRKAGDVAGRVSAGLVHGAPPSSVRGGVFQRFRKRFGRYRDTSAALVHGAPPSSVRGGVFQRFRKRFGRYRDTSAALVLGCDTVVECAGQILGKPADRDDARRMLHALRGREHRVLSGLCLWPVSAGQKGTVPFLWRPATKIGTVPEVRVAVTILRMDLLGDEQIEEYLSGGQWEGKAGAFGYQDRLGWVHVIEGSESNVVGLPLELLAEMLRPYPFTCCNGSEGGSKSGSGIGSQ